MRSSASVTLAIGMCLMLSAIAIRKNDFNAGQAPQESFGQTDDGEVAAERVPIPPEELSGPRPAQVSEAHPATVKNSCWCGSSASKWDVPSVFWKRDLAHEEGGLHQPPHYMALQVCTAATPCECCRKVGSACVANAGTNETKHAALRLLEKQRRDVGEGEAGNFTIPSDDDLRKGKYCVRYRNTKRPESTKDEREKAEPTCFCGRPNSKWFPPTVLDKLKLTHDDTGFEDSGVKPCSQFSPCGECTHMGDACVRNVGDGHSKFQALLMEVTRRKQREWTVPTDLDLRLGRDVFNKAHGSTCWCGSRSPKFNWQPKVWQKSHLDKNCGESTPCKHCQQGEHECVEDSGTESVKNRALKDFLELGIEVTEVVGSLPRLPELLPPVAQPVKGWRSWFR